MRQLRESKRERERERERERGMGGRERYFAKENDNIHNKIQNDNEK